MNRTPLIIATLAVAALSQAQIISVYDFNGNLNPVTNSTGLAQPLEFVQGRANPLPQTVTYSSETINGFAKQVANFITVPGALPETQGFRVIPGWDANGGSALYVNQYSVLWDIKITGYDGVGTNAWQSLWQTNAINNNDGDLFIRGNDGGIGIAGVYGGAYQLGQWARIVATFDLVNTERRIRVYLNGALVNTIQFTGNTFDGRFAAFSNQSNPTHSWLLMDNNGESGSGQISQAAFFNEVLTPAYLNALGPAGAPVAPPVTLTGNVTLGSTDPTFVAPRTINWRLVKDGVTQTFGAAEFNGSTSSIQVGAPSTVTGPAVVELSGGSFLIRKVAVTLDGTGVTIPSATMINGDVDQNNEVDLTDIDLIIADYLTTGGAAAGTVTDLDANGEVDLTDIDIAIGNYLQGGD